jgi:hypothetical protein
MAVISNERKIQILGSLSEKHLPVQVESVQGRHKLRIIVEKVSVCFD